MAKLSDIFPEENGNNSPDQRIQALERRLAVIEELVRSLYSANQTPYIAPVDPPQPKTRRRKS